MESLDDTSVPTHPCPPRRRALRFHRGLPACPRRHRGHVDRAGVFPRYHIDESLLLSCLEIALLRYARSQGTGDHEGVQVQALDFDEAGRPCRAHWVRRDDPSVSGVIAFDDLIDASGLLRGRDLLRLRFLPLR